MIRNSFLLKGPSPFILKCIVDFPQLIAWPVHSQYVYRHWCTLFASISVALQYITRSSTYMRCVIFRLVRETLIPFNFPAASDLAINLDRMSKYNVKIARDIGSLYWIFLSEVKYPSGDLLSSMEKRDFEMHCITNFRNLSVTPQIFKIRSSTFYSTRSYALMRLILITIYPILPCFELR